MKNKYIFLGDIDSINIELIFNSFSKLKKKVNYIVICNLEDLKKYKRKSNSNIKLNELSDPLSFNSLNYKNLNCYHVAPSKIKIDNLIAQINLCNKLCNLTGYDLITMPINKYSFKKKITFKGMTEYFGMLNNQKTLMLMVGENFSIIPITTHINLRDVSYKYEIKLNDFLSFFKILINKHESLKKYENFIFLCFNPHCSEEGLLGFEDLTIKKYLIKFKKIQFKLKPADSAFKKIKKKTLYISFYHDQALIPFKILNQKSYNETLGLNYRRLSPSHGTAKDIKYKNIADNTSYLQCMIN